VPALQAQSLEFKTRVPSKKKKEKRKKEFQNKYAE
jgi:hypothetical protein